MRGYPIHDEFSHIHGSERRYQLRRKRDGMCIKCGKKRDKGDNLFCQKHRETHRAACRKYQQWLRDHGIKRDH